MFFQGIRTFGAVFSERFKLRVLKRTRVLGECTHPPRQVIVSQMEKSRFVYPDCDPDHSQNGFYVEPRFIF